MSGSTRNNRKLKLREKIEYIITMSAIVVLILSMVCLDSEPPYGDIFGLICLICAAILLVSRFVFILIEGIEEVREERERKEIETIINRIQKKDN